MCKGELGCFICICVDTKKSKIVLEGVGGVSFFGSVLFLIITCVVAMVCDFELGFDVVDRKCKNS